MTQTHDDDRLREEFHRLRVETEGSQRVPDFRAMLEKARADAEEFPDLQVVSGSQSTSEARRRRIVRIGGWATGAVAAALAGLLLLGEGSGADREFERLVAAYSTDMASGAWRSPTSGLLDVTGMGLTRSMPSLGVPISGVDPDRLPNVPEPEGMDS